MLSTIWLGKCRDDETRLKLLRVAARAWKELASSGPGPDEHFAGPAFTGFFGRYWRLLPPDEARPVLADVFHWALEVKTETRRFPLTDNPGDPELTSEKVVLHLR